jgi:broad specificity phosphatase PhoE
MMSRVVTTFQNFKISKPARSLMMWATPMNEHNEGGPTMSSGKSASTVTQAALDLAKKEHAEHMDGMKETKAILQRKPLRVKAYKLDNPMAPAATKTVHFARHGQGFHNLMADITSSAGKQWTQFEQSDDNPYTMAEILDAPLTDKGRQQAIALQDRTNHLPIELLVFSPNCRALQTGLLAFAKHIGNCPCFSHEMVREETGVHVCDRRRPKSQQAMEFPQVDFSLLEHEEDLVYREDRRESKLEVGERIYTFLEWLAERPEQHVGVASHSGWLLTMFNAVVDCGGDESLLDWWHTGEMRSVKLEFQLQGCAPE